MLLPLLLVVSAFHAWRPGFEAGPQAPSPSFTGPERVRVGLVLIEVAVRDRKDRAVTGLTLEDFELQVDGNPVPRNVIPVFEETCPGGSPPAVTPGAIAAAGSNSAPEARVPARGIVLYFDLTAISFQGRQLALAAARRYLARASSDLAEVMILSYARGDLTTVQGFTTDSAALSGAVGKLLKDRATVDLDLPDEPDQLEAVAELAHTPACLDLARVYALAEQERARASLEQLKRVVEYLSGRKDRMNLVLMTDALRLEPGAQYMTLCDTTPFMQGISLEKPVQELIDATEASGISIYTVHAGGLVDGAEMAMRYPGGIQRKMEPAARVGTESALGMQSTLALQTGGRALRHSNDVAAIFESARQDLACHYLLGYAPTSSPDGQRHALRVKVNRNRRKDLPRDLDIRHRPYFIDRIP